MDKREPNDPLFGGASQEEIGALSRRSVLKLGLSAGAFALISPAFAQSSATPKRGGTLTIAADADPIGLDPTTTGAFSSYDFTGLIYTGLLRWNADMKVEPDLALSYENPDPTTYVFKLRQGVKFHNGQDFSAEDVKYTFDRMLDPKTASPSATSYSGVKAITVVDPYTIKFELARSDAAFLSYLATSPNGSIVPKGVTGLDTKPIGTGPFVFDSYTPNQQFTLKANPNYYEEGQPYLDMVVFKFYKDQSTIASALRSKTVDMTWLKDPKVAALMVKTSPDLVSAPGQTSRTFPIWLNMKAKPMSDVNVRRALSLATDRAACLQTVLGGSGKVGATIPESQVGGYNGTGDLPYYKYDPDQAKKLLADAGYPNGIDLGDYLVVAANALDVACAQILQQQWAKAGIKVNIRPMETAPLLAQWTKGDWGTLLSVALSWSPDPDAILQRFVSTGLYGKASGMADTKLDGMIADARAQTDLEKRAAANLEIQKYIADNAYVIEVYQYPLRWEMWWNYVHDYVPLAANIRTFVRTTWLDK